MEQIELRLELIDPIFSEPPRVRYTMGGEGLYMSSRMAEIREALAGAKLSAGDRFVDLGSGDGRVVFAAAAVGARAMGIEADPTLHDLAEERGRAVREILQAGGASLSIELMRGNFFDHSLKDADVVFYYSGGSPIRQKEIYRKLEEELRPGARLILFRAKIAPEMRMEILPASRPPFHYIFRQGTSQK